MFSNTSKFSFALLLILIAESFTNIKAQKQDSLIVYLFLSETCPICQSISQEIRFLVKENRKNPVKFIGVFPSKLSNEQSRSKFSKKYNLDFDLIGDTALAITTNLKASITPEVVVMKKNNNEIVYRGLIDNSFASIGKRRKVVTEFYLRDALFAFHSQIPLSLTVTKPVGCIIQQ